MANYKILSISLTVRDRAISSKFSKKCTLGNFQKIFPSPHMAAILNFRIFAQNGKHKFALTVQNRVISLKFSTHRVSKRCTLGNFQEIFLFPKVAAILNFQIFAKNRKTLHMIMCVLLCYRVSIHMSQLLSTGRPISSSRSFSEFQSTPHSGL